MPNLVIVSNRLPVSVKKVDGKLEYHESVGGLSMGLAAYASDSRNKWIGWPGISADDLTEAEQVAVTRELATRNFYPIFLTQAELDGFYNGYSNRFIWPLFHDIAISESARKEEAGYWKWYQRVNDRYAALTVELSEPDSHIWVHDYHLFLLPELLRAQLPEAKVGFFLHIPFPAASTMATLKNGQAMVEGILGSDLIGLQIKSYTANFMSSVEHYQLGTIQDRQITLPDHVVRVTDFPIGIDYDKWRKGSRLPAVRKEYARLRLKYLGLKVIVSAERFDPTKGFLERITAYGTVLRNNPGLHKKMQFVLIAVPSRTDIAEYQQLKRDVDKLVASINAEFGTKRWKPIDLQYTSLAFEPLRALYQRADVAFITPLRDGMNLVAKEYLASKPLCSGVLVLSESAGAAQELHDTILVNPRSPASMAAGLERAVTMPSRTLAKQVKRMHRVLERSTIYTWAGGFMKALNKTTAPLPGTKKRRTLSLNAVSQANIVADYNQALRRLIMLDYDGTLAPFAPSSEQAVPTAALKKLLRRLAASPSTDVVVVSGRQKDNLDAWLGDLGLHFAAEHGAYSRSATNKTWHKAPSAAVPGWKSKIVPILEHYATMTPGAVVEQKSTAVVWHYRLAKPYAANKNLAILKSILKPLARSLGVHVRQGNMILEVKAADVHKGTIAREWLQKKPDFVLAIGDDYTDEDMFKALPATANSVKVGRGTTNARYRVTSVAEVLELLEKLT